MDSLGADKVRTPATEVLVPAIVRNPMAVDSKEVVEIGLMEINRKATRAMAKVRSSLLMHRDPISQ